MCGGGKGEKENNTNSNSGLMRLGAAAFPRKLLSPFLVNYCTVLSSSGHSHIF